jgi:GntR family transcriptional regulator/MocR family aminotransferase
MSREQSSLLRYPPPEGHPDLLEAIASHIWTYRTVQCTSDQIVIVNGSQQGLNLLAQLLLDSGDRVIVEDPGYPAARAALQARGLDVVRVPVDGDGILVDAISQLSPFRLIHVTPSHQEPTGATLSLSRRLALLDLARNTGCFILEDDYDSEFRYEGRPVESLQGLDRHGLVVYAGTFSKSVLAGLRLGFLVVPHNLVRHVIEAKRLWDSGSPMLEQAVLAEFIRSGEFERHIRRSRREYRVRRDALVAALTGAFGDRVEVGERHGGLNILVRLRVGIDEDQILKRAAAGGIGLRSAAVYYSDPPTVPTLLVGFAALAPERICRAVDGLAAALL